MIRFVDLRDAYWGGDEENMQKNPCCAFLNTVNDQFVTEDTGGHVFFGEEDLKYIVAVPGDEYVERSTELRERCRGHVPEGFWGPK